MHFAVIIDKTTDKPPVAYRLDGISPWFHDDKVRQTMLERIKKIEPDVSRVEIVQCAVWHYIAICYLE